MALFPREVSFAKPLPTGWDQVERLGEKIARQVLEADTAKQYHVHYHWIGGEVVIDHSPFASLELARAASDGFNAEHDAVHEAYSVVVAHKRGS